MKTKENGENEYKMVNDWLRNCRSFLALMEKEVKDAKRDQRQVEQFSQLKVYYFHKKLHCTDYLKCDTYLLQ